MTTPLVLVGHGSRDARSAEALHLLTDRVRAVRPDLDVRLCFLELSDPPLEQVLDGLTGRVVAVPLLLSEAHHARVDVPARMAVAGRANPQLDVIVTGPLGQEALLEEALVDRARSCDVAHAGRLDGWVLVAAGSSYEEANAAIHERARRLARRLEVPVEAAFATTAAPDVVAASAALRDAGCRAPGLLSWFLAPGRVLDRALAAARQAGITAVTDPLADHRLVADAVLRRASTHPGQATGWVANQADARRGDACASQASCTTSASSATPISPR